MFAIIELPRSRFMCRDAAGSVSDSSDEAMARTGRSETGSATYKEKDIFTLVATGPRTESGRLSVVRTKSRLLHVESVLRKLNVVPHHVVSEMTFASVATIPDVKLAVLSKRTAADHGKQGWT